MVKHKIIIFVRGEHILTNPNVAASAATRSVGWGQGQVAYQVQDEVDDQADPEDSEFGVGYHAKT